MKKKILLSSVMTIALCLSLIAGSTFALFTSQSTIGIAATAGEVEVVASVEEFKIYSVEADPDGSIVDENGGKYKYVQMTDTFANGGTAEVDGATITLDKITPGDKVEFTVDSANKSNVAIQCRYIIECDTDYVDLMKGLVVTINGVAYPALKSYTSAWVELTPAKHLEDNKIVVELPVTAGNEYQGETAFINVRVEAVQGNADVTNAQTKVQFLDGKVDLTDLTVTDTVSNYGSVELVGGTIAVENTGFENYGDATLTDITLDAGTPGTEAYGYALNVYEGSTTVLNDVTVNSANGAIGVTDGAELTFNGGYVEVNSQSTSGRYLFYVVGEGSVATINGGDFYFNKTQNQKRAYAYVGAGATLYITGGNFGTASTRNGYTAGLLGNGEIIITGGTFGFDPTTWVANGYQAIKNGATWYVVPETVDSVATTADELTTALANGDDNIVVIGAEFTENNLNGRYYTDRNVEFVDCTFKANMNYMYINNATYTNCTFDCGADNAAVHYDELFGDLVFNNCTFISGKVQIGANAAMTGTVAFNNCTFAETTSTSIWSEKGIRVYSPATFTGCEFNNRVVMAGSTGLSITFNDCTMNGGADVTDAIIKGGNVPTVTIN